METRVSKALREVEDGPGEDGDEERRPRRPDEPPGEPQVESAGPTDVEVEPGGETGEVECNKCAARENADADVDGEVAWACRDADVEVEPGGETDVERNRGAAHEDAATAGDGSAEETHRDVQAEAERSTTRRNASIEVARWCASAYVRSTTKVEETGQRTSQDDEDIPGAPPDLHPPSTNPAETTRPPDEPPSVELEGERILYPSGDVRATSVETDASGALGRDEDAVGRPKKLRNTSKLVSKHLEHRSREDSPGRPGEEPDDPGAKADASEASWTIKDVSKRPRKLRKPSERVSGRSKRRNRKHSPGRPGEEPDEPDGVTVVPGDVHRTQEGPRGEGNQRVDDANALCRDTWPGGQLGEMDGSRGTEGDSDRASAIDHAEIDGIGPGNERNERGGDANPPSRDRDPGGHSGGQVELRVVEGGSGRHKVVDRAGYDWIHPRTDGNERVVETNAQCRDGGPGGRFGEQVGLEDIEGDRERQSDGDGDQRGGRRGRMDDATSGARHDSKRVGTTSLAEGQASQHGRHKRETADVPRTSTPATTYLRRPTDNPNPPRRRGRLKPRSTRISNPIDGPTRSRGRVKAVSGGSDASYMLYTNRRSSRRVPKVRYAKTATPESIEADRAHLDSATTSRAATYHIG